MCIVFGILSTCGQIMQTFLQLLSNAGRLSNTDHINTGIFYHLYILIQPFLGHVLILTSNCFKQLCYFNRLGV